MACFIFCFGVVGVRYEPDVVLSLSPFGFAVDCSHPDPVRKLLLVEVDRIPIIVTPSKEQRQRVGCNDDDLVIIIFTVTNNIAGAIGTRLLIEDFFRITTTEDDADVTEWVIVIETRLVDVFDPMQSDVELADLQQSEPEEEVFDVSVGFEEDHCEFSSSFV